MDRLPARFADEVPQRNIDIGGPAVDATGCVIAEIDGGADAGQYPIGADFGKRSAAAPEGDFRAGSRRHRAIRFL